MAKRDKGLVVQAKGIGVGKTTVGLGFEFERSAMDVEAAVPLFVGARLEVILRLDPEAKPEDAQTTLLPPEAEVELPTVTSIADCHRLSVATESCTARLTFRREDVDMETLLRFASCRARLTVKRIGDARKTDEPGSAADDAT